MSDERTLIINDPNHKLSEEQHNFALDTYNDCNVTHVVAEHFMGIGMVVQTDRAWCIVDYFGHVDGQWEDLRTFVTVGKV